MRHPSWVSALRTTKFGLGQGLSSALARGFVSRQPMTAALLQSVGPRQLIIHDRCIGNYALPAGSVIIGAGNRAQDAAIVRPMSSALMNRRVHVQLSVSHPEWLSWATEHGVHPLVLQYLAQRPDHSGPNRRNTRHRFRPRARGTLLQPAVELRVKCASAYLVPEGRPLALTPSGPVFRLS